MKKRISYLICVIAMMIACTGASAAQENARKTRYEGSVSAGAAFKRDFGFGAAIHTSHGIRFNKEGLKFLYIGGSLESAWMHNLTQVPLLVQLHAKANFPTDTRLQMFVGMEAGAMIPLPFPLIAPNFSPSIGFDCYIKDKKAITLTVKTYVNPESKFGQWWSAGIGFKF